MDLLNELQRIQEQYGYLPVSCLGEIAKSCGRTLAEVVGAASFYDHFSFAPGEIGKTIENLYPCRKSGPLLTATERYPWSALKKARQAPASVIPMIQQAGLLGRGGGGFPTWSKWSVTRDAASDTKYVVCNADEGEPGTGKDRVLLTQNPCAVLEGMAVCALAVGAQEGFLYLRGEYADLRDSLQAAVDAAPLEGFRIEIRLGQGAYVCGEETALIRSMEGRRGEPWLKPPYPGVEGYLGKPTVVNNVETFACAAWIVDRGPEDFRAHGNADYTGTKLYTVLGKVNCPGVYEMEAGITLRELIAAAGGESENCCALLIGGGSGTLLRPERLDMPLTIKGCAECGASLGTGSVRLIGESENLWTVVRELTAFYNAESCGVCVPCRVGLRRLKELQEKAECGRLWNEEAAEVAELAAHIRASARCGLAQAAVTPTLSLLENFPEVLQ